MEVNRAKQHRRVGESVHAWHPLFANLTAGVSSRARLLERRIIQAKFLEPGASLFLL
jgi:hypothetical protein